MTPATSAVVAPVTRPLASIVTTPIAELLPYVPADTPEFDKVVATDTALALNAEALAVISPVNVTVAVLPSLALARVCAFANVFDI